jgi:putative ABC transport system permease protein
VTGFITVFQRLNLRHFKEKRLRTLLTVSGVGAGVMLVFSIGLINTTLIESIRSSVRALAGEAEIEVATADRNGLPQTGVQKIAAVEGVDKAVPILRATTTMEGRTNSDRPLIIGITPEFVSLFPREAGEFGRLSLTGGFGAADRGILLSQPVARDIGVRLGDRVVVETPSGPKELSITGRLTGSAVGFLNGGRIGVMLLPAAQETFDRPGKVDSIYVVTDRDTSVADVEERISTVVQSGAVIGPPGERGAAFEDTVGSVAVLTSLAGTVALLVAVFVVFNTMSMSLAERRREISMSLALGTSARQMFAAFLTEAAVLGLIASLGGLAAGYGLAHVLMERVIEGFPVLPISGSTTVVVAPDQVVLALLGGLGVSIAGAFVPARRVLQVAPVESLRPEASYEWSGVTARPSLRKTFAVAVVLAAVSVSTSLAYIFLFREQRWLVNLGLVFGLTAITALLIRAVPFAVEVVRPAFGRVFGTVGRLAVDALAKNPGRTTFTVAALTLTLGMVIGVGSALGSYQSELYRSARQWLGAELYVTANSYRPLGADQPLQGELRAKLIDVEGVDAIYPVRYAFLQLGREQMMMYAIPAARAAREGFGQLSTVGGAVDHNKFIQSLASGRVFIARFTAEQQGWETGDRIELPTPEGTRVFVVGGIFDDLNSFQSMFIEHDVYKRFWNDTSVDRLGVVIEEGASLEAVRDRLQQVVRAEDAPARVLSQEQAVGQLANIVEGLFQMARGIQFAALVVALLTIANTMFTAVLERRWEMGLQRAIGMARSQMSRSLLLETGAIGLIGGVGAIVMGTATGFLMTQLMEAQYAWRVPYQVPVGLIAVSVIAGIGIALAAGFLPTRLAVRVPIIESLRYE